jgi:hypothetical protein
MHLSVARLCLDCQEIHADDRCPACTSEAFGFMTRWVKLDATPRSSQHKDRAAEASRVEDYRQILNPTQRRSTASRWLRKGGLVVAAGVLARWGWQLASEQRRVPRHESSSGDGSAPTDITNGDD